MEEGDRVKIKYTGQKGCIIKDIGRGYFNVSGEHFERTEYKSRLRKLFLGFI